MKSCRAILIALALLAVGLGSWSIPAAANPPRLEAESWMLIDARTGEPLAAHRENRRLPMASTTKMMTAYLALKSLPLGKKVPAADYDGDPVESLMGLEAGQRVSVRDLLYGLILLSGNDAAVTLAEAVSGTEARFVKRMNAAARQMGLTDTHYENPIGLDGKRHYTTANDLATLGREVMSMPRFRRIAAARQATLRSYQPPVTITTRNDFVLNNGWAKGIKTGHTQRAGYVLASDGRRRATELVGAVIGTDSEAARDAETVKLMDYGFSLYTKRVPVRAGRLVAAIPVKYQGETLAVTAKRSVRVGVREGERVTVRRVLPDQVEGPISKGQRVGAATVLVDGDRIATVQLVAGRAVEEATLFERLKDGILLKLAVLVLLVCGILGIAMVARRRRSASTRRRLRRVTRRTR